MAVITTTLPMIPSLLAAVPTVIPLLHHFGGTVQEVLRYITLFNFLLWFKKKKKKTLFLFSSSLLYMFWTNMFVCIWEMQSLCNACGIRFKKEERRATAAASTTSNNGATSGSLMEPNHMAHNNSWYAHSQTQKMPCYSPAMGNEFRFIEDNEQNSDTGIPFLSWRLNVTDRPGLVHDFTRWKIWRSRSCKVF